LIYEALQRDPREAILQLKINLDSHLFAWHVAALPSLPSRMGCMKGNFDVASRNNFTKTGVVINDSSRNIILATTGCDFFFLWKGICAFGGYCYKSTPSLLLLTVYLYYI
jgi:hypothetical protein